MEIISSPQNARIKEVLKLYKTGVRKDKKLIIIDGEREILAAIAAGQEIVNVFFCPELMKSSKSTIGLLSDVGVNKGIEVSVAVFKKICYKDKPDGLLVLSRPRYKKLEEIDLTKQPLIVILESVEKPGNLGAIIRTAYAAGVTAVIINDQQTDIYNPNVIRASEGLIFSQLVVLSSTSDTIAWLKKHKIKSLAAATSSKKNYTDVKLTGPTAIVLGSEAQGLSQGWLTKANLLIKIPMRPGIDSLNVSVAAAIVIFEALRQRAVDSKG
jgi:TrmH family RNA methyltransferase